MNACEYGTTALSHRRKYIENLYYDPAEINSNLN